MNKYYLKVTSFIALFGMCVALLPVGAAGVSLTAGDAEIDAADVGTDGFATSTVSWTSTDDYATGTVILVTVDWSDTTSTGSTPQHGSSTALGQCSTPSTFDAGATYGTMTADSAEIIINNTAASGATGNVCVRVPVEDGGSLYQANFSMAIITSNVNADYGAAEFYVDGGNDILVDASVQPTLEFAVVSSTDVTVEQHECHMGTLDLVSVGTCDYRLKVSTNAANGFQVTIDADQQLGTGYATLTPTGVDTAVVAGTEGYGIALTGATLGGNDGAGNYDQPITEDTAYDNDDNPVPVSSPTNIVSYTDSFLGTSTPSTSLVTHNAAIDAATVVGYYSQTVTYEVTPSF